VLLDTLGKDADEDHDGLISMSELTYYVAIHVPTLTRGSHIRASNRDSKENSSSPVSNQRKVGFGRGLELPVWRTGDIRAA